MRALWIACAAVAVLGGCSLDWDRFEPRPGRTDASMNGDGDLDADVPPTDVAPDSPCGTCQATEQCCGTRCANVTADPENCGRCGVRCPNTTCQGAVCTNTCVLGFMDCNMNVSDGCETNVLTSNANCGACGTVCSGGRACVNGTCSCVGTTADCDMSAANGCEVDTNVDSMHCGACNNRCPAGQACVAGACVCPGGLADCDGNAANGCEVDPRANQLHCGGCNRPCGDNASCVMGMCQCSPGTQRCPSTGACNTPTLDPANCGMCGRACDAAMFCAASGCVPACPETTTACGRSCVDLASDARNCGMCGRACGAHQRCAGAAGCACEEGFGDCDMDPSNGCEVDLRAAGNHCGMCGRSCGAGQLCLSGTCSCAGGLMDCGGRCAACCNDAQCDDGMPCTQDRCEAGTCTHNACARCCPAMSGGMACRECCADADCTGSRACGTDGTCGACRAGFGDCDMNPANGCEARTDTLMNCGACGMACNFANATGSCTGGRCVLSTCNAGFLDCDMNPANGCEVDARSNAMHCGRCNNACVFSGAMGTCSAGTCMRSTCDPGRGDCDSMTSNGCETDLNTTPAHCGACGMVCRIPRAVAGCSAGACTLASCEAGYANCNATTADGCEVATSSDLMNCGSCGRVCAFDNAVPVCSMGTCALASCRVGFGDCDRSQANGCETPLTANLMHCGACGNACTARPNATVACTGGTCVHTCNTGFSDCDGLPGNGCETNTGSSLSDCGGCGRVCAPLNATGQCTAGVCSIRACFTGLLDCDGLASTGCETNPAGDVSNCGGCGNNCMARPNVMNSTCSAGTCRVLQCAGITQDCDGVGSNGCEATLNTAATCERCGIPCMSPRSCVVGACTRAGFAGYAVTTPSAAELPWVDACSDAGARRILTAPIGGTLDDQAVFFTTATPPPMAPIEALLPFSFEFWGGTLSSMLVSTNGYIVAGNLGFNQNAVNTGASYGLLPSSAAPAPGIFPFGRDLFTRDTGVCLSTRGTAPNRKFYVLWSNAALYGAGGAATGNLTFEVVLSETTNVVEFVYNTPWSGSFNAGMPSGFDGVTVGLQNAARSMGASYTGTVTNGTRVRFTPMP